MSDESDVLRALTDKLGLQVNLAGTGNSYRVEMTRALLLAGFALRTIAPLVLSRLEMVDEALWRSGLLEVTRLSEGARLLRRFAPLKNAFDANTAAYAIEQTRAAAFDCQQEANSRRAAHVRLPRNAPDHTEMLCVVLALSNAKNACYNAAAAARDPENARFAVICAVAVADAITKAIKAGVPEDELLDLVVDVVADAMVMR